MASRQGSSEVPTEDLQIQVSGIHDHPRVPVISHSGYLLRRDDKYHWHRSWCCLASRDMKFYIYEDNNEEALVKSFSIENTIPRFGFSTIPDCDNEKCFMISGITHGVGGHHASVAMTPEGETAPTLTASIPQMNDQIYFAAYSDADLNKWKETLHLLTSSLESGRISIEGGAWLSPAGHDSASTSSSNFSSNRILQQYGLTEELLKKAFVQSVHGLDLCWALKEIPTVGFYRELHDYLKKWPPSSSATRCTIGKLYINMDPKLHHKYQSDCTCPDDVYKFIEKVVSSKKHNSTQMSYGLGMTIQCLQEEVGGYSAQIQALSAKVMEQNEELSVMRREVKLVLSELGQAKQFLKDIAGDMQVV